MNENCQTNLDTGVKSEDVSGSAGFNKRAGEICPQCHQGRLDYNGLMELVCPVCKFTISASFT